MTPIFLSFLIIFMGCRKAPVLKMETLIQSAKTIVAIAGYALPVKNAKHKFKIKTSFHFHFRLSVVAVTIIAALLYCCYF
ncbi:hypothetical protein ATZ36_07465 [Candidatus Endomicrobiellum trichonymphae]|jgi:hypothetical protein|uniref:Uncharacterized protein n=1 Tax=Endomicrobium trichonymphae TaxID=1408204 RepID=A0A1E5IGP7_ENDTX|nr:hypothetical protein ATZ36_08195 [Candidatus Endomicrobium trichonymphae]OEG69794.1 hypothetical protein ATZ36_07465 [Candidatus Endomicrobium trichonymphae]